MEKTYQVELQVVQGGEFMVFETTQDKEYAEKLADFMRLGKPVGANVRITEIQ